MRVRAYRVLDECVDKGIIQGWYRAHKHTDSPTEADIKGWILDCVMNEITEYFTFTDEELGVDS